ncbi:hypothetical protein J6590_031451 [Homalodisca vitripennis]|nr:hypothetical protein J6590_031451 [Homalodisca vitripennis]
MLCGSLVSTISLSVRFIVGPSLPVSRSSAVSVHTRSEVRNPCRVERFHQPSNLLCYSGAGRNSSSQLTRRGSARDLTPRPCLRQKSNKFEEWWGRSCRAHQYRRFTRSRRSGERLTRTDGPGPWQRSGAGRAGLRGKNRSKASGR